MMGPGTGMGGMAILWFLIVAVLLVVPFWRLLPQFGMPPWLALIAVIPLGAVVLLWIMAFRDRAGGGPD